MPSITQSAIVGAVLAFGAWQAAGDDEAVVRVRVVDVLGRPVAGAEVEARATPPDDDRPWLWPTGRRTTLDGIWAAKPPGWDECRIAAATTDEVGVAVLSLPRDLRIDVTASAPGFAVRGAHVLQRTGRERSASPTIVLDRGHPVSGTLFSEGGEPVADAVVLVRFPALGHARWTSEERPLRATTDARGAFRVDGVPAGEVTVFAAPRDVWFERMHVLRVPADPVEIRIPVRRFRAVVRDAATGAPVPRADVLIEARGWHHSDTTLRARTDAEGRFEAMWCSDGVSGGRATADGYLDGLRLGPAMGERVLLPGPEPAEVEFVMVPAVAIDGVVLGEDGPVEGAWVMARRRSAEEGEPARARSGPGGRFTLRVAAGRYHVAAAWAVAEIESLDPDEAIARGEGVVSVGPSERSGVVVALRGSASGLRPATTGAIEGVVERPDGSVPESVFVTASSGDLGASVDALGRFRFELVAPGSYDLAVRESSSDERIVLRGVRVEPGKSTSVALRVDDAALRRVRGRVEVPDGFPSADAWVEVSFDRRRHPVRSDGSFEFSLRPRYAAPPQVVARATGLAPAHASAQWTDGADAVTDLGVLVLETPERFRVIEAGTGSPLPSAAARLEFLRSGIACGNFEEPVDARCWRADAEGWIAIDADLGASEDPDRWDVIVFAPERIAWTGRRSEIAGEVSLPAPATFEGRVRFDDGAPVRGAVVEAGPDWSSPFRSAGRRRGRTDSEGRFRLEGLSPGANVVEIESGADGDPVARTRWDHVEVPSTGRDFVVERALVLEGRVVDALGRPLADVSVDASDVDEDRAELVGDVETDARGQFRIVGVLPGRWKLTVRYDGVHAVAEVVVEAGRSDVEIATDVGHRLRGRLVDPGGIPLAGRRFVLRSPEGVVAGPFEHAAETGPDGRFTIDGLLRCRYSVALGRYGEFALQPGKVSVPVAGEAEVTFVRPADETR